MKLWPAKSERIEHLKLATFYGFGDPGVPFARDCDMRWCVGTALARTRRRAKLQYCYLRRRRMRLNIDGKAASDIRSQVGQYFVIGWATDLEICNSNHVFIRLVCSRRTSAAKTVAEGPALLLRGFQNHSLLSPRAKFLKSCVSSNLASRDFLVLPLFWTPWRGMMHKVHHHRTWLDRSEMP